MHEPGPLPPPRRRHGCLWGCLAALGIVIVLIVGGIGYMGWFVTNGFKHDETLAAAVTMMNANPTARAVLGDHIEVVSVTNASITTTLGSGKTETVSATVKGSRAQGHIDAKLHTQDGKTEAITLLLTGPDGRSYELTAPETQTAPNPI